MMFVKTQTYEILLNSIVSFLDQWRIILGPKGVKLYKTKTEFMHCNFSNEGRSVNLDVCEVYILICTLYCTK